GGALGGRVGEDDRVLFPLSPGSRVRNTTPQVHHLLSAVVGGERRAVLGPFAEGSREHVADALESRSGPAVDNRHLPIIVDSGIGAPRSPAGQPGEHSPPSLSAASPALVG